MRLETLSVVISIYGHQFKKNACSVVLLIKRNTKRVKTKWGKSSNMLARGFMSQPGALELVSAYQRAGRCLGKVTI